MPATEKENIQKSEVVLNEPITLIFAGDVMHHMPQMNAAYVPETNSLDYTPCVQFVKPVIQKADLAFCNLETSLGGKPFSGYPKFSSPDELLFALKDQKVADLYLKLFCKKSDTAMQYVQQWLPIVAAAQLSKENELEKDFLMRWIDVVDYQ